MKVLVQMDLNYNAKTDNSIRLAHTAAGAGATVYLCRPNGFHLQDGVLYCQAAMAKIDQDLNLELSEFKVEKVDDMQVVLMRQDPPFNLHYLTNTYLLEYTKALVINNPKAVRDLPEKLAVNLFPQFILPTLITSDPELIIKFARDYDAVVIKPLYSFGGDNIFHWKKHDFIGNLTNASQALLDLYHSPVMVQQFCPNSGDKRVTLVEGEVAMVFKKGSPPGDFRSNTRFGGSIEETELTPKEAEISKVVGKKLKELGITLAGLDIMEENLLEINVTCVGGIITASKLYNFDFFTQIWGHIEKIISHRSAA